MSTISGIHLRRLHAQLGNVVYEMTKVQLAIYNPPVTWSPALNVYRCENCLVVCADLAGVDKSGIELKVETERLLIRGRREAPEPKEDSCKALQVLAMEIDYGVFEREVMFPVQVDSERVTAEQRNGLLWIYLPFRTVA
jgi:HSP20 family protein